MINKIKDENTIFAITFGFKFGKKRYLLDLFSLHKPARLNFALINYTDEGEI